MLYARPEALAHALENDGRVHSHPSLPYPGGGDSSSAPVIRWWSVQALRGYLHGIHDVKRWCGWSPTR